MSKRKNNYRVIADFQPAYIRCRASPPRPSLRYDRGYRSLTLTCRAFSPCSRCTKPRLSHQHHNMSGFQPLLPLHKTTLVTPTPQHVGLSALAQTAPNHTSHTCHITRPSRTLGSSVRLTAYWQTANFTHEAVS